MWCYFDLLGLSPPTEAPTIPAASVWMGRRFPRLGHLVTLARDALPHRESTPPRMCVSVVGPPARGRWKAFLGPHDCRGRIPFASGPLNSWHLWVSEGNLRPCWGEGGTYGSGAACDGVISLPRTLAVCPGCISLGGGQKSQAWRLS